jgi:flagellin
VQSANGTNSVTNRASMQQEITQLVGQIDTIAFNTEFNGVAILSANTTTTLQIGPDNGASNQLAVVTSLATATALAVNALTISTAAGALSAILTLDSAIDTVTSNRARLGATQNRLEFTINTLAIEEENSTAAESAIRDANIATETIKFTRNQILVSAGTSVLAQANLVPQTALQLLR